MISFDGNPGKQDRWAAEIGAEAAGACPPATLKCLHAPRTSRRSGVCVIPGHVGSLRKAFNSFHTTRRRRRLAHMRVRRTGRKYSRNMSWSTGRGAY